MRLGVALPQYAIDVGSGLRAWDEARRVARRAERLGLDAVWLSDHPFALGPDDIPSGAFEPLVAIGALARATDAVGLGTLVLASSMRTPALTGHMARTLAQSGPGRITAGVGTGWYEPEHRAFGVGLPGYGDRAARLERTLDALRSSGARTLCGGAGDAVIDVAARRADAWNVAWDVTPDGFSSLSHRVDAACERAGRDPRTLARTVGLTVAVAEDSRGLAAAVERLRARAVFLAGLDRGALCERIVCGTPEACAERIAAYAADEVIAALLLRDDPEMLDLYGERVAPLLR